MSIRPPTRASLTTRATRHTTPGPRRRAEQRGGQVRPRPVRWPTVHVTGEDAIAAANAANRAIGALPEPRALRLPESGTATVDGRS